MLLTDRSSQRCDYEGYACVDAHGQLKQAIKTQRNVSAPLIHDLLKRREGWKPRHGEFLDAIIHICGHDECLVRDCPACHVDCLVSEYLSYRQRIRQYGCNKR